MFKHLLVPVDGSAIAESAIDTAVVLARAAGAEIGIVMAHPPETAGMIDATVNYTAPPSQRTYVRRLAEQVASQAHVVTNACVEIGDPADVIFRRARELGADLIVMTSHGRTGLRRAFLGSVAQEVLRLSNLPVLMLRPHAVESATPATAKPLRHVLVPLDGSTIATGVIPSAANVAKCGDGTLILLRVIQPPPLPLATGEMPTYPPAMIDPEITDQIAADARRALDALASTVGREYGLPVKPIVTIAHSPADTILSTAEAESADVIAMTPVAHGASRLVFGCTSDRVLRHGHLTLLIYRPSPSAEA